MMTSGLARDTVHCFRHLHRAAKCLSSMAAVMSVVFLLLLVSQSPRAGQVEEGFRSIFNGKDLAGWDGDPRLWSVKDGAICGETTDENRAAYNTFLIWRGGTLADFELRLSFRIRNGNSGVQVRSREFGKWRVRGYQAEVTPTGAAMGLFYDEAARGSLATAGQKVVIAALGEKEVAEMLGDPKEIQKAYKEGDWNDYAIIGRGNHLIQKINGVVFSEVIDEQESARPTTGILALQIHTGPPMRVEFKDIRLKDLGAAKAEEAGVSLFNGKDLTGWEVKGSGFFHGHGEVFVKDGNLHVGEGSPMTGVGWKGEVPKENFEIAFEARRVSGSDFFCGMTFPVGDSHVTLIVGGWGGTVVGLSNIDDMNASENDTTFGKEFGDNRWYGFRVRVSKAAVEVWIDNERVINQKRESRRFTVWEEQSPIRPFGFATYQTEGALRNIRLRRLGD